MAGMLLVLSGALLASPVAGAAEIPPTNVCLKGFHQLSKEYSGKFRDDLPKAKVKKLEREFTEAMVEVGCISDAEPLLKKVDLKPFTEECKSAARDAGAYWKGAIPPLARSAKAFRKRFKPVNQRVRKLNRRINRLRAADAAPRRVKAVIRARDRLKKRTGRMMRAYVRQVVPLVRPIFYNSYLILMEMASRRCLPVNDLISDDNRGPAARMVGNYQGLILGSFIFMTFYELGKQINANDGSAVRSGEASASAVEPSARLPFLPLP